MVADKQFLGYLERKRDPFEEGTVKYKPRELMDLVLAKYTTLIMKEEWLKFAPTDAEQVSSPRQSRRHQQEDHEVRGQKQKSKPKAQNDKGNCKRDKGKQDGKGKDAWKTRKTTDTPGAPITAPTTCTNPTTAVSRLLSRQEAAGRTEERSSQVRAQQRRPVRPRARPPGRRIRMTATPRNRLAPATVLDAFHLGAHDGVSVRVIVCGVHQLGLDLGRVLGY
jgi:hypothetical protein